MAVFDPDSLSAADEPVRRYLTHALGGAGVAPTSVRLRMAGRIRVGRWLSFAAEQEFSGHEFVWRARAGWGRFKPLHVTDAYRRGAGSTDGRLFGRVRFLHAGGADTARAAAGRAAAESIWVPATLLPEHGVAWRSEAEDLVIASVDVPPERAELRLRIDDSGAVRSLSLMRWGDVGRRGFGYIPFGGEVHAERRFRGLALPSEVTVGWWYGTPRWKPFFLARILDAVPVG